MDLYALPGHDLIEQGLDDLAQGSESIPALLVSIGAPRLRDLGLSIPERTLSSPEIRLYEKLQESDPDSAHSRYNALIRTLVSFERAAECARLADAQRVRRFMEALARQASDDARAYFTGGATAVLIGWRETTIDIDIKLIPERNEILRAIPGLKENLEINLELASPGDFIPELPSWQSRSAFIATEGPLSFYHYDFYAQTLAKIERGHARDREDVREMIVRDLVEPQRL